MALAAAPAAPAQHITMTVVDAVVLKTWLTNKIPILGSAKRNFPGDTLTQKVVIGALAFTVSNSEMPVEQADPAAKKRKTDETKVSCHEAAQLRTKTECVECPKCAVWFHSNCIVRKFNDDPEKIRADPKWTCWHCRGVCGHHSCVTMREDGKRAGEVELHVDEGKKYYSLIMEATTAGHKSVQDHLKATGRDAW